MKSFMDPDTGQTQWWCLGVECFLCWLSWWGWFVARTRKIRVSWYPLHTVVNQLQSTIVTSFTKSYINTTTYILDCFQSIENICLKAWAAGVEMKIFWVYLILTSHSSVEHTRRVELRCAGDVPVLTASHHYHFLQQQHYCLNNTNPSFPL